MADEWVGEWLRRRVEDESGGEVLDVVRSFRVNGRLVELLRSPDAGYFLMAYRDDGTASLLGNPDQSLRTMLDTVQWHKLRRTGKVW